ncbi:DUF1292 domain-containing protein [Anaeromicropila herbilytica]|uniref:DUF1292 domain-containing protein n=1 Tax=Anaeromicropila herbilytica TaxID=2785025 RepID=A0A7R7ENB2_9FIRM|nr:DUF1292 domain-containing protein [Anaeromicropila herbilytica]BCN31715.1 hypothetical protein bsdtb5_30100 [Anaeromicropila herbilytica]
MEQEKLIFTTEDNEEIEFYVLEQTKLNGINYILVTDRDDDEAEALILKDISQEEDEDAIYDIVEDDNELKLIAKIFEETLDDIDIEM